MNLAPRWKKVLGDVQATRGRVAAMVFALATGLLAVVAILSAYTILTREIARNYAGVHPASAHIQVDRVDDALLRAVRSRPEVSAAEAGATLLTRIETGPATSMPALLFMVPDFRQARLNTVIPARGAWPPPDGTMLIERTALPLTHARVGATVTIRTADGRRHGIGIAGLVHDPALAPAWQEQTVYGYINAVTFALLAPPNAPLVVKVGLRDPAIDAAGAERAVADIVRWMTRQGYRVGEIRVPPPREHPHQAQMTAMLATLLIFSLLAFALCAILAATMVGGMLARQVRQIGVMKAIGARSSSIARLYLALVLAISVVALALGLPAGMAAGRGLARVIAELLNVRIDSDAIPTWATLAEIAVGLLLPLLAALPPIRAATRMTVREAIGEAGASRKVGAGRRLHAILARFPALDRSFVLALRNAFRRPGRLALMLALLGAAGATFMTSLNVQAAWQRNLAVAGADRRHDLELYLTEPADERKALALVTAVPGVRAAGAWNTYAAAIGRPDGLDIVATYPDGGHGSLTLRAAPPDTSMLALTMLSGRWLRPDDAHAVVLNHGALARFPGAAVGSAISLEIGGRQERFTLVGVAREILRPATAYVTPTAFGRATGLAGLANDVRVAFVHRDPAAVAAAAIEVRRALEAGGIMTKAEMTEARLGEALTGHLMILIVALLAMACIMAGVGALALLSVMGTSVLERTREFGIMRTLGGTSGAILRNVIGEGVFIGLMSAAIAVALSLPLSWAAGRMLGRLAYAYPLPLTVSWRAIGIWLLLVVAGAVLSSAYPARKAARLTIRATLAHL
jgi:putative ABC transport system permease protein